MMGSIGRGITDLAMQIDVLIVPVDTVPITREMLEILYNVPHQRFCHIRSKQDTPHIVVSTKHSETFSPIKTCDIFQSCTALCRHQTVPHQFLTDKIGWTSLVERPRRWNKT